MTNEEFIQLHSGDDVSKLALKPMPEGIEPTWCWQQIEGRRTAKSKLPLWANTDGVWFPPRLSMEQCSSEVTARYKREIVERLLPEAAMRGVMVDATGGFGIDFTMLAPLFEQSVYVEPNERLCELAHHNFPLLGVEHFKIECGEFDESLHLPLEGCDFLFIDPSRRDKAGRKTVAVADCVPDVSALLPGLLNRVGVVMIKLSPMLDISRALHDLSGVVEIHVVAVRGECKELLFVCRKGAQKTVCRCVNLGTGEPAIEVDFSQMGVAVDMADVEQGCFLYEPNVAVLKASVQDLVAVAHGLAKLHPMSHLYLSRVYVEEFPGRKFRVVDYSDFSKHSLRRFLDGVSKANLTIRNFPASVAELRKRLKLKEGGDTYLFATTLADNSHVLIKCEKV
ncbi:MAG: hypothetical protein ACI4TR_03085 [Bacteroidaceae bacterium]